MTTCAEPNCSTEIKGSARYCQPHSTRHRTFSPRSCRTCGEMFQPQSSGAKYCGDTCRGLSRYTTCPKCGGKMYKYSKGRCLNCYSAEDRRAESGMAARWAKDWVEDLEVFMTDREGKPLPVLDDPFVRYVREAILDLVARRAKEKEGMIMSARDVAEIMGVRSGKLHHWLGLGESRGRLKPLRPRLHHTPGVARLVLMSRGIDMPSVEEWEREIARVCELLGWKPLSPGGLFVVRKLWEQGHSVRWLRDTAGGGHDWSRLLYRGIAVAPTCKKVSAALKLTPEEGAELRGRVRARDEAARREAVHKTLKRSARRKERIQRFKDHAPEGRKQGARESGKRRSKAAQVRIRAVCMVVRARGNPAPTQTAFETDYGFRRSVITTHMGKCTHH